MKDIIRWDGFGVDFEGDDEVEIKEKQKLILEMKF